MEQMLLLQPDEYSPVTNAAGEYEDRCPDIRENGIQCLCSSRKHWVFTSRGSFRAHLSCAAHKRWLADLNQSKFNFYRENIELRQLVANQKLIIAGMERENLRLRGELFRMIPVDTLTPIPLDAHNVVKESQLLDVDDLFS